MKFAVNLHIMPTHDDMKDMPEIWQELVKQALELIPGVDKAEVEPDRPAAGIGEQ